jgi:hypothetical protein
VVGEQEAAIVVVAYLEPGLVDLFDNVKLLFLNRSRSSPMLSQISPELLKGFLKIFLLVVGEQLVHQEKLERTVAVHPNVLLPQFWKRKLGVS